MPGHVALVLHAHLPYVRHPEHPRSIEERWLFEALWECYLPLLDVLDRLAADRVYAPLTLSVSPPLLAMLRDGLLRDRFDDHLARLSALAARVEERCAGSPFAPAVTFYRGRLATAARAWRAIQRDLPGALVHHASRGRVELLTTAATHAYLPGLLPTPASIRAQLRLGRGAFERLAGAPAPAGLWLPECAYDPRLDADLAAAGVRFTVLDAHGLLLADPPAAPWAPVLSPAGVVYFARDRASAREVWSRDEGYPAHPAYREFYRDVGFDLPEAELEGELGPNGARLMTGLKLHRITSAGPDKAPYDPARASAQARADAAAFVARREAHLAALGETRAPIVVAPYDAELFGHFWLEGPEFLEHALRGLAASRHAAPISLGAYLERHPPETRAQPAASTWGEGGFGKMWTGPRVAPLWRHVHHTERAVLGGLAACRGAAGDPGRAIDQAIRELLLLESSDWAFMISTGDMAPYAASRVREHAARARRLVSLSLAAPSSPADSQVAPSSPADSQAAPPSPADSQAAPPSPADSQAAPPSPADSQAAPPSPADLVWLDETCARSPFLTELPCQLLRDAFAPWR